MPSGGTVSGEIRHLMKDRGFPQKRAVAASLSMQRAGKIRKSSPSRAGRRAGRRK